jgi:translation elongation factor EF-Ts
VIGVIVDVDQEAAPEFLHEKGSATASKKPSHVAAKR